MRGWGDTMAYDGARSEYERLTMTSLTNEMLERVPSAAGKTGEVSTVLSVPGHAGGQNRMDSNERWNLPMSSNTSSDGAQRAGLSEATDMVVVVWWCCVVILVILLLLLLLLMREELRWQRRCGENWQRRRGSGWWGGRGSTNGKKNEIR